MQSLSHLQTLRHASALRWS